MDTITTVRQFIIDNFLFGDDSRLTSPATSFLDNGIVDSTGMLELIGFIEERYNIAVADTELLPENLDSLENIARFVAHKQAATAG